MISNLSLSKPIYLLFYAYFSFASILILMILEHCPHNREYARGILSPSVVIRFMHASTLLSHNQSRVLLLASSLFGSSGILVVGTVSSYSARLMPPP